MIHLEGVSKIYRPEVFALKKVDLHIRPGEFVSIVGRSGSGKTTLAKLLIAEERPTEGKVMVGNWDITKIRRGEIPTLRRQIGIVFQDFKLLPKKKVFENVAFALEVSGMPAKKIEATVPQVLKIVSLSDKAE